MRKCSMSLNHTRHHYTLTWMAKKVEMTKANVNQDKVQWKLSYFVVKTIQYNHSGNCLTISHETEHIPTLWPKNYTPRHSPQKNKMTCLQKFLQKNTQIGFILNLSKMETAQASITKRADKWWSSHRVEYYLAIQRNVLPIHMNDMH